MTLDNILQVVSSLCHWLKSRPGNNKTEFLSLKRNFEGWMANNTMFQSGQVSVKGSKRPLSSTL